jgi:hypothetical protein
MCAIHNTHGSFLFPFVFFFFFFFFFLPIQRGHSTAGMAGRNGANCDAKVLILNHISPKMEDNLSGIVREAYNASGQKLSVLVSFDFMEVLVPWLGFGTATETVISTTTATDETAIKPTVETCIENDEMRITSAMKGDDEKATTRSNVIDWSRTIFTKSEDN